jgi:mannose-6-phosphate isomerase
VFFCTGTGLKVAVVVNHVMNAEAPHYIMWIRLTDGEGNELGKAEMWVVLHAEPGAELILGVRRGTTPEAFRQALAEGNLEPYLHHLPIRAGDVICVPTGTLHAILGGSILAEIQQNSNTTYRVYDWNRVDAKGNQRPLHIDKALDVINFEQKEPKLSAPKLISHINGIKRSMLCQTPYFTTEKIEMDSTSTYKGFCSGETLEIWGVIEGKAKINKTQLNATGFALLPAKLGEFEVFSEEKTTLLRIYVEKKHPLKT